MDTPMREQQLTIVTMKVAAPHVSVAEGLRVLIILVKVLVN